ARSTGWSAGDGLADPGCCPVTIPPAPLPDGEREGAIDGATGGNGSTRRVAGRIAGLILRTVGRRFVGAPPEVTTRRLAFTSPPPSRARRSRRPGPRGRPVAAGRS